MPRRLRNLCWLLLGCVLLLSSVTVQAQKKLHSPKKAGIMSAVLPGLGQVYNGKWWKVPIVYAGLGGIGYLAYSNYTDYHIFLNAYKIKTGDLEEGVTPSTIELQLAEYYQASQLQTYKESFRRDFELYCILLGVWYGLNIVDAVVDGHLYTYDISDDLSFSIDPNFNIPEAPCLCYSNGRQTGLTFAFHF